MGGGGVMQSKTFTIFHRVQYEDYKNNKVKTYFIGDCSTKYKNKKITTRFQGYTPHEIELELCQEGRMEWFENRETISVYSPLTDKEIEEWVISKCSHKVFVNYNSKPFELVKQDLDEKQKWLEQFVYNMESA